MKKGLIALFAAVSLCGSTAFAIAPAFTQPLPDITIGDAEDNGVSDNNYFVYTNAFKFSDYVTDPDTPEASLLWSFDEGDPAQQWFTVNNKAPIHVGTSAMSADSDGGSAHLDPGANNLRAASGWATFRDIIFTPGTAVLPPGYAAPTEPAKSAHAAGKVVKFYVSDSTTVTASNEIIVKTIDNAFDAKSTGSPFTVKIDEKFTTASSWIYAGNSPSSVMGRGIDHDYDSVSQALRLRCYSATTYTDGDVRHRIGGWYALLAPDVMLYSAVGPDNIARGKFYVYATGQATSASNQIPCFQLRMGTGYQVTSNLEISPHLNAIPGDDIYYDDLAPAKYPNNPSLYRVDIDPIDSPYLAANANSVDLAIRPAFSIQALDPQDNGYVALAECVMGTYPASLVPDTAPVVKSFGLADMAPAVSETAIAYDIIPGTVEGSNGTGQVPTQYGGTYTGTDVPTITYNASTGVTHDGAAVPSTKIGVTNQYFSSTRLGALPNTQIARVEPNKQYRVRFKISSTQQANRQSAFWLYVQGTGFGYAQKTEFAGSRVLAGYNDPDNAYGREILPSTTDLITDDWYTVSMYTPMSADIGPQPQLNGQPGPGSASPSPYRDIDTAIMLIDSFNASTPGGELEQGNIRCSAIEIRAYDAVLD